jgi:hypothetical protein
MCRVALLSHCSQELLPDVRFRGIPEKVLLTFGMDVQPSWLAFPQASIHDLDNIRLLDLPQSSRSNGVEAVFELRNIIVEGHARDLSTGGMPPRGLQLVLAHSDGSSRVDSLYVSFLSLASSTTMLIVLQGHGKSRIFPVEGTPRLVGSYCPPRPQFRSLRDGVRRSPRFLFRQRDCPHDFSGSHHFPSLSSSSRTRKCGFT